VSTTDTGTAVTMRCAGAASTVSGPVLDSGHGPLPSIVPETAMTPLMLAGAPTCSSPSLPVPATTTASLSNA
jgi:hypothetical protein